MDPIEAQRKAAAEDPKIAVVVIHGMGEQKPMQTLRSFVVAAWQRNKDLFDGLKSQGGRDPWDVWTKPDTMSGSTELRRIATRHARSATDKASKGQRADFFELHWADLTADNTWWDFLSWFATLLLRNPFRGSVPPRVFLVWCLLWAFVATFLLSLVVAKWPDIGACLGCDATQPSRLCRVLSWDQWPVVSVGFAIVIGALRYFLPSYFGDVARYVSAAPRNIKVRQEARQRGLKLLDQLSASGEYNRIIVVGHSLGSILAHDLVLLAWGQVSPLISAPGGSVLHKALRDCETAGDELLGAAGYSEEQVTLRSVDRTKPSNFKRQPKAEEVPAKLAAFRKSQRELFRVLSATPVTLRAGEQPRKSAWLISDLVTLGSPLTHAEFLLSETREELNTTILMREALRCPPVLEKSSKVGFTFLHDFPRNSDNWRPHHGAAMAPVRWTNIHDASTPLRFWLGDLISGPLARDFGAGVVDIKVTISRPSGFLYWLFLRRFFTHTLYWNDFIKGFNKNDSPPDHVLALQQALNFLNDEKTESALLARNQLK